MRRTWLEVSAAVLILRVISVVPAADDPNNSNA